MGGASPSRKPSVPALGSSLSFYQAAVCLPWGWGVSASLLGPRCASSWHSACWWAVRLSGSCASPAPSLSLDWLLPAWSLAKPHPSPSAIGTAPWRRGALPPCPAIGPTVTWWSYRACPAGPCVPCRAALRTPQPWPRELAVFPPAQPASHGPGPGHSSLPGQAFAKWLAFGLKWGQDSRDENSRERESHSCL